MCFFEVFGTFLDSHMHVFLSSLWALCEEPWPWIHSEGHKRPMELGSVHGNSADTQSPRTRAARTWADTTFGLWLVQFGERKRQRLGFTFPFLLPLPKRLLNSLFTHLELAHSNNSPCAWILQRHCLSYSVLSCFHDLRGWLSAIWKPPGMCRVMGDFNFNHAWHEGSSIYLQWPVFKIRSVRMKENQEKTLVWTPVQWYMWVHTNVF